MFDSLPQDQCWLDSLPFDLDFVFEHLFKATSDVNEPVRYMKPNAWFYINNGLSDTTLTAAAFAVSDTKFVYVPMKKDRSGFAFESARYIESVPEVIKTTIQSGDSITLDHDQYIPGKDITLGHLTNTDVWQNLRNKVEGKSGQAPHSIPA